METTTATSTPNPALPTRQRRGAALLIGLGAMALVAAAVVAVVQRPDKVATPNVAISADTPPSFAYHRPAIAADPVRPGHLAVASMEGTRLDTCYLGLSADEGRTWTQLALVGAGGRPVPAPATKCWNPKVAYAPDGTLYYVVQARWPNNQTGKEALLYVSDDGGSSFRDPVALDQGADGSGWWPDVAVDASGRVYIAWSRRPDSPPLPGRVMLSTSSDRGRTLSAPVSVSPPEQFSTGGPLLAVGGDGKVYVSYQDHSAWLQSRSQEPAVLRVAVSADQGQSFELTPPVRSYPPGCVVAERGFNCDALHGDGPWMLNSVVAGVGPGQVFVAWWEPGATPALTRVWFSASADGGKTWASPLVIGVPPGGDGNQQHRPWLSVAPNGRLDVAYYDRAPDGDQLVYWTSSTDAGRTFSMPRRLTDRVSDSSVGPPHFFGLGVRGGDYLALSSSDDAVVAAWTDTRRGCELSQHQDVFFTRRALGAADPKPKAAQEPQRLLC